MYRLSLILCLLYIFSLASALPDYLKRFEPRTVERRASDPCCKSCAVIAQVEAECPATADILCGCDQWVKAAPGCEACIYNVGFNTTFATNPGPSLELFWAWCQCPSVCHDIADAIFGASCGGGTDALCVSTALATKGPACSCCLHEVDEWFASFFDVWVEQGKEFVKTGVASFPGTSCTQSYANITRGLLGR